MNFNVERCHQSINNDELPVTKVERETFPWSLYVLENLHAKDIFLNKRYDNQWTWNNNNTRSLALKAVIAFLSREAKVTQEKRVRSDLR